MAACARPQHAALGELYQRALVLQRQDDPQQAVIAADKGLKRVRKDQDNTYYWKFRLLKAEVLLAQGDPGSASALIEGSIPASTDFQGLRARQQMDRGWVRYFAGDFSASLTLYDQAAQFARDAGDEPLLTEIEMWQGRNLLRVGRASASETDFLSALARARRLKDSYLEASALGNLALLRMNGARYDEAIDRFQQALTIFERIHSRRLIARTFENLGYCELRLGETEKALGLFQEAAQRASSASLWSDQQVSLGRIGDCYHYGDGDFHDALVYYRRALGVAQRTQEKFWIANWLYQLATISIDMGDLGNAERYNNQALALQQQMQDPVEQLYPLLIAGQLAVARGQMGKAQDRYESIIASTGSQTGLRNPEIVLEARSGLARMLVKTGRFAEAEKEFRKTLELINSTRSELTDDEHRITYLSSLVRFYQAYVEFLAGQGRNADAFLVAESSRARLLSERLRGADRPQPRPTVTQLQDLSRRSHSALLAYWLAPHRSFLWVITPAGLATFVLPPQEVIADRVEAYKRAIDNLRDPLATPNPAGEGLYETVLAPARPFVPQGSRVAIVPDGALYNLSFATIPVPGPNRHYWIEDAAISVVPSLSMLVHQPHRPSARPAALLLIGDPSSANDPQFPPLLNARLEVEQVGEQFQSGEKLVLTGHSAQPDAYAAAHPERFSFIHFTAHATANLEDPLDSAIILSPLGMNYKLYARDVMSIPTHALLVTISACHSAGARAYAGEGLVGFAWAFLRAGARHVIGGLWEVDDRSTSQLMARLYENLSHGSSPAAALRDAQLSLLKSENAFRKPYYWAPFELFTDALEPSRTAARLSNLGSYRLLSHASPMLSSPQSQISNLAP
jgi:CHAT domain-containing protein/Tfp pilus assembly protein PilF